MRVTLYVLAALFELGGIVLVGSPDLFPGAVRLAAWLRGRLSPLVSRFLRLIGRPRAKVVSVTGAGIVETAASISAVKSVNAAATLEEQVAFLLRRDQEAQRDVNALREKLAEIEREAPRRLDELRAGMEEHVERKLTAAQADFRAARILGVISLLIGLGLTTAASLAT